MKYWLRMNTMGIILTLIKVMTPKGFVIFLKISETVFIQMSGAIWTGKTDYLEIPVA